MNTHNLAGCNLVKCLPSIILGDLGQRSATVGSFQEPWPAIKDSRISSLFVYVPEISYPLFPANSIHRKSRS